MTSAKKIRLMSLFILVGFISGLFFAATKVHHGYPYATFLFKPGARFNDFYGMLPSIKTFSYCLSPIYYFPLTFWLLYPLTLFHSSHHAFYIYSALFCTYSYFFMMINTNSYQHEFNRIERHINLIILTFLSFPMLYCLDRGNLESLLFIFLSLSISCFYYKRYYWSSLFLAVAICFKFYPVVFLVLFLKEKRFKEFFTCIALTGILTFLALASLHGGIIDNIKCFLASDSGVAYESALLAGVRQSGTIMAPIKVVLLHFISLHGSVDTAVFKHYLFIIVPYYNIASVLLSGLLALYILFFEKTFWKQVSILTMMTILFPAMSYDYKFIHLLIPFVLFAAAPSEKAIFGKIYLILFAILFIPKNYYLKQFTLLNYPIEPEDLTISICVFIDVFVMCGFIGLIIFERWYQYKTLIKENNNFVNKQ
ncbi:MAG: hypothetical protein A2103_00495 [Gammaproteobacteria bacterium GWF2_41_13]|nr:MAG: hypothetical protein A2103_00495 [Gammaproteobacteria bacterium GWF2_41_13]